MSMDIEAEQQMDLTQPIWTSLDFLKKRKEFNDAMRTEASALAILQELVEIQVDQLLANARVVCNSLIKLLLKSIRTLTMLVENQTWLVSSMRRMSSYMINMLAVWCQKRVEISQLMQSDAIQVSTMFAVRMNDRVCYKAVAYLLAPVSHISCVLNEIKKHMIGSNSLKETFCLNQIWLESLRQNSYHIGLQFVGDNLQLLVTDHHQDAFDALDFLSDAAEDSIHGSRVLSESSFSIVIYARLNNFEIDDELIYGTIRYLSSLCHWDPSLLGCFTELPKIIFDEMQNSDDEADLMFIIDSFRSIVTTAAGKRTMLIAQGENSSCGALKTMFTRDIFRIDDLNFRVLAFFGSVFDDDEDDLNAKWFAWVAHDVCALVINSLFKSADRVRRRSIITLGVLLSKRWVMEEFMKMEKKHLDTFIEWVTGYTDPIYDHIVVKKQVLSRFVASDVCAELVDPALKKRIEDSLRT